ncbi:hypothetical protein UY3_06066 [Chelonia mydas]|uniref:Uncharacterized protein n=1 Tax=Chelonia mydas TaxID=8469 RepID=M7BLZ9_CHEMY|nr:hypothetical protein UY3_06066 [Chelonia mydas]
MSLLLRQFRTLPPPAGATPQLPLATVLGQWELLSQRAGGSNSRDMLPLVGRRPSSSSCDRDPSTLKPTEDRDHVSERQGGAHNRVPLCKASTTEDGRMAGLAGSSSVAGSLADRCLA